MADNKIAKLGMIAKRTRKEHGLTQEQLAAAAGGGIRFIREFEHGKESCHIGKVMTVLLMLGIELIVHGEPL